MEQLLVSLIMARGNNQLALPSSQEPRMLSLTNEAAKPDYVTNFQGFREFLEDNNGISKLQEALRKYQNQEKKRSKSKNFTIVNQHEEPSLKRNPSIKEKPMEKSEKIEKGQQVDHDNSMLSLGDFLNLSESNNNQETPI